MCVVATGLLAVSLFFIRKKKKKTDATRDWDQLSTNLWARDIARDCERERVSLSVCHSSRLAAVTMTTSRTQEWSAWDSPRIPPLSPFSSSGCLSPWPPPPLPSPSFTYPLSFLSPFIPPLLYFYHCPVPFPFPFFISNSTSLPFLSSKYKFSLIRL